jgi:hypothetical protein
VPRIFLNGFGFDSGRRPKLKSDDEKCEAALLTIEIISVLASRRLCGDNGYTYWGILSPPPLSDCCLPSVDPFSVSWTAPRCRVCSSQCAMTTSQHSHAHAHAQAHGTHIQDMHLTCTYTLHSMLRVDVSRRSNCCRLGVAEAETAPS